ncbi:MAG: hypothetical protein M3Q56_07485 [Bacteroidota bacterium]|nr:hypothetical protein [Bacteroidota bacterium]
MKHLIAFLFIAGLTGNVTTQSIWHIKAIDPAGRLIPVKALDMNDNVYDIKAFVEDGNTQFMDVKAIKGAKKLPVKIIFNQDAFAPVKAIEENGNLLSIKAITADGKKLDVKGVSEAGNIIHIKAIGEDGEYYGIKAISPEGVLHDVKGVKFKTEDKETTISGVDIRAHIKALPQVHVQNDNIIMLQLL